MKKIIKAISIISLILFINGCAKYQTEAIEKVNSQDYNGKDTQKVLSSLKDQGFYCLRYKEYESDKRLMDITDGTLNKVKFHICTLESSDFFCVKRTSTMVMSQYNKILKVNGMNKSKACLWTY